MVEGVVPFMAVCLQVQTKLAQQPQSLGSVTERPAGVKIETPDDAGFARWDDDDDDDRLNLSPSLHQHVSYDDLHLARLLAIRQLCCA
jgi:hypothetical protein